ncbi:MAG: hypothetical protein J07AB43_03770 [Candidatus Nanosalina sp. J07AB43]|nr:MAG: hypothetical protein J07AB43_03770 [Candidatus Nanosalina sp. J07AB43]
MIAKNLFIFLGEKAQSFFPKLEGQLRTARMDKEPEEYLAECFNKAIKLSVPITAAVYVISLNIGGSLFTLLSPVAGIVVFAMGFLTFTSIPNIKTKKRTRKLEKELPYALRDILIQIDPGFRFIKL